MKIDKEKKCVEIFDAHWYKVNDDLYYPSVTSVLGTLNKGFGYDEWLRNVGWNSKLILEKAQRSGSKIHHAIELFLQNNTILPDDFEEEEWVKMCNFANWFNNLNIKVIATENELIDDDMQLAGTCDFVCKIDDTVYLIDFKTGNAIHEISHLQTACYTEMWNKHNKIKIQKAGILHVGASTRTQKDLNNKGIKFEETDLPKYSKLFHHTLEIYNEMYRQKPPLLKYPCSLKIENKSCKN